MNASLPISKSQLGKLGDRLVKGAADPADRKLYGEVLDVFDQVQVHVRNVLDGVPWTDFLGRSVALDVSGRTKTLDTLLQKLARTPGLKLPYIRDVAGVRLVGDFTLSEQTRIAEKVREALGCPGAPLVDRRKDPESGYRALHVVVTVNGMSVEVQVRTRLQGLWADLYERTADTWGRQIRYGQPPDPAPDELSEGYTGPTRAKAVNALIGTSVDYIAGVEELLDTLPGLVDHVSALQADERSADMSEKERTELIELDAHIADLQVQVQEMWKRTEARLVAMADQIEQDVYASSLRDTLVKEREVPS